MIRPSAPPLKGGGKRHDQLAAGIAVFASMLAVASFFAIAPVHAQKPDTGEIHGLKLGLKAPTMTMEGFGELACGSNGGPPRQRISEILRIVPGSSLVVAPSDRDLAAPEMATGLEASFGGGGYSLEGLAMAWCAVLEVLQQ